MTGTLHVVSTPIGNMKDITLRALEVLKEVDMVVAESRERALKLFSHYGIHKTIVTINGYNEERKADSIVQAILSGRSCALISGAGTPCISDPGRILVSACREEGIDVRLVPGPCAAAGAFAVSGLHQDKFLFYGFLPLKRGKKRRILAGLGALPYAVIFYESPRRLCELLRCIGEEMGERTVVVMKELTKVHESYLSGKAAELLAKLEDGDMRGEYVVIVDGPAQEKPPGDPDPELFLR